MLTAGTDTIEVAVGLESGADDLQAVQGSRAHRSGGRAAVSRCRARARASALEPVWGYRHAGDTRVVNVHVQRLRSKIGHDREYAGGVEQDGFLDAGQGGE